jgi:hypothetical protein
MVLRSFKVRRRGVVQGVIRHCALDSFVKQAMPHRLEQLGSVSRPPAAAHRDNSLRWRRLGVSCVHHSLIRRHIVWWCATHGIARGMGAHHRANRVAGTEYRLWFLRDCCSPGSLLMSALDHGRFRLIPNCRNPFHSNKQVSRVSSSSLPPLLVTLYQAVGVLQFAGIVLHPACSGAYPFATEVRLPFCSVSCSLCVFLHNPCPAADFRWQS